MGVADTFGDAFYKAQLSAGVKIPEGGTVFISVNNRDKRPIIALARRFLDLGFGLLATRGTASALREAGLPVRETLKVSEGRPNCVDAIKNREIDLIINTPLGQTSFLDGFGIRTAAIQHGVPIITTISGAAAAAEAVIAVRRHNYAVASLQELHESHHDHPDN
jgi:carbamoyl-phosphate synthase large subunit